MALYIWVTGVITPYKWSYFTLLITGFWGVHFAFLKQRNTPHRAELPGQPGPFGAAWNKDSRNSLPSSRADDDGGGDLARRQNG